MVVECCWAKEANTRLTVITCMKAESGTCRQVRLERWTLVGSLLSEPSAHSATASLGDLTETMELGVHCRA